MSDPCGGITCYVELSQGNWAAIFWMSFGLLAGAALMWLIFWPGTHRAKYQRMTPEQYARPRHYRFHDGSQLPDVEDDDD